MSYKTLEDHSKNLQEKIKEQVIILINNLNQLKEIDETNYSNIKHSVCKYINNELK